VLTLELKIAKIGNSRGVRIPAEVLRRHAFTESAIMVESVDGILLRPKKRTEVKMSWADTAKAMAVASESWSDWDVAASDGLADLDLESSCVAEKRNGYGKPHRPSSRRRT
jgi:antitoxin component of MazEF toxin-antitoxin module